METERRKLAARTGALLALAAVAVLAALREAQTIVLPFLFSCFLAALLSPIVGILQRRRWPILPAVLASLALVFLVGLSGCYLLFFSLQDLGSELPRYTARLLELAREANGLARARGVELHVDQFLASFDLVNVAPLVTDSLKFVVSASRYGVMVFFITLFALLEGARFKDKLRRAFGERNFFDESFRGIAADIQRYLVVKTAISLATGVAVGLFLWAVGIPFPLLWGMVAFALNYIPSVGSVVASVPPVLLALLDPASPLASALVVALGLLGIQTVLGSYVDPRLMGENLNLSALVVFLSMVFWGWMWGPAGMLMAVPLTVCVKVGLAHHPRTAPLSKLLES